jgi:hypothetical protein
MPNGGAGRVGSLSPNQNRPANVRSGMKYLIAASLTVALCASALAQLPPDEAIRKAETVLRNLQDARADAVVKEFDAKMAAALPADKLKGAWASVVAQFGALKNITERRVGQVEERQAVELFLAFEKETIVYRTVFDAEGKIVGLVFRPASAALLPASK